MKNLTKVLGIIVFITIIGFVFVACAEDEEDVITLADFNGEFKTSSGETWTFDRTNKAMHVWYTGGSTFTCEVKLEDDHFWYRLWENQFSSWDDQGAYSLDKNRQNLKIGTKNFVRQ
jgi:hypothetical protein